ncbi:unnamed protein product, partial [marine sediment metagenome]
MHCVAALMDVSKLNFLDENSKKAALDGIDVLQSYCNMATLSISAGALSPTTVMELEKLKFKALAKLRFIGSQEVRTANQRGMFSRLISFMSLYTDKGYGT